MFGPPSTPLARRTARIVGEAPDYAYDPESPVVHVEGMYEISMIRVYHEGRRSSHCECVAFHVSGFGPRQIVEPIGKPTLASIEFV
jgi:hypothetical protein